MASVRAAHASRGASRAEREDAFSRAQQGAAVGESVPIVQTHANGLNVSPILNEYNAGGPAAQMGAQSLLARRASPSVIENPSAVV